MTKKASTISIFILSAIVIVLIVTLLSTSANTNTLSQVTVIPATTTTIPTPVTTKPGTTTTKPVTTATATQAKNYTLAQIAQHPNAQSCWTAVNGGVYDVTSWINQHPGGSEAILGMCGRDASADYNDQHGGERRPANELATFKIGTLVK